MMDRGRMIDVSHTVEHGMVTYKGLPAPVICDFLWIRSLTGLGLG
jgi:kynurenine formamidase